MRDVTDSYRHSKVRCQASNGQYVNQASLSPSQCEMCHIYYMPCKHITFCLVSLMHVCLIKPKASSLELCYLWCFATI